MGRSPAAPIRNVLTFDVEDYFHVSAFDTAGARARWDSREPRIEQNTDGILRLLDAASVTATFFVLGWVADRHPALVRRIAAAGHEIASHGYWHQLVYHLTPTQFRDDLRRAKRAIEDACGLDVVGYRAPSFSVTRRSLWALDVLVDEGYRFDSSVFPIVRDRYGLPGAPRQPHVIARAGGSIVEVPPSTVRVAGLTVPVAGGGYFRLYPYSWTRRAIARVNRAEGQPAIVYLHPWEFDPEQPAQQGTLLNRFRHYVNLDRTAPRLRRLLGDFAFGPMRDLVQSVEEHPANATLAALPALHSATPAASRPRAA